MTTGIYEILKSLEEKKGPTSWWDLRFSRQLMSDRANIGRFWTLAPLSGFELDLLAFLK